MCMIVLLSLPCATHDFHVSTYLVAQEGLVDMAPVFSSSAGAGLREGTILWACASWNSRESQAATQTHLYINM